MSTPYRPVRPLKAAPKSPTNLGRKRAKKCGICREPGHNKTAHTVMEQQQFRLTGQTIAPMRKVAPGRECAECHAQPGERHQPFCRRFE